MARALIRDLPAPTKGWNTVDSIDNLPPDQAIILDNWIPSTSSVISRKDKSLHATAVGSGNVDSLYELKAASVSKMIAAASGGLYDVTSSGAASILKSGFNSNQWQATVFNAQLGLVNGADAPQVYNGTTVSNMTVSGVSDVTQINFIITYKNRTYFGLNNSQSFYYSPLSTMGGALTEFPLGRVGNFGGNLVAARAITKDGGDGQDDALCFFMSTGEVIIYEGLDPGNDFVLRGVFNSGRPISPRAIQKFGADILSVTNEGYIPISSLLPLSFGKTNNEINRYIKGAASAAVASYGSNFGWQITLSPTNNLLIVGVPQTNNTFVQHVLNVNTLAWTRFTGLNARCWCTFGNDLYYGGTNGAVYKYGPNYSFEGAQVPLIYQSPYFSPSKGQTRMTAFRPRARFDADVTLTVKNSVDFKPFSQEYSVSYQGIGARWGDPWGSTWATSNAIINYLNLNNIGYTTSLYMKFLSGAAIEFFETNFLMQTGGRI